VVAEWQGGFAQIYELLWVQWDGCAVPAGLLEMQRQGWCADWWGNLLWVCVPQVQG